MVTWTTYFITFSKPKNLVRRVALLYICKSPRRQLYSHLWDYLITLLWNVILVQVYEENLQASSWKKYFNRLLRNSRILSVQFSCSVMSDSWQPHESQHARPPCPSPTPGVHSESRPSSQWCHPVISSSVIPFSSSLQSSPASGSSPMSQFFASGGQSIGVSASASVLPMNTQD